MDRNWKAIYGESLGFLEEAKEMLALSKPKFVLISVRQALESAVKTVCARCNIDLQDPNGTTDLMSLIDKLKDNGIITDAETAVLHRIRMLGNKGAHVSYGEEGPTMEMATEAVELLSGALERMMENHNDALFSQKSSQNNVPMRNPDYYSPNRRYYGMWFRGRVIEDLAVSPEYLNLKEKADRGDVAAMLDLAVGFLPKQIAWSPANLVCMPRFRDRDGSEYYVDTAYDARYYYWVVKAAYRAVQDMAAGKSVPLKYLAMAFLETAKFHLYTLPTLQSYYISGQTQVDGARVATYDNQYEIVRRIYGECISDILRPELTVMCLRELLNLLNRYDCAILTPIHKENTPFRIKYLAYCMWCFCSANGGKAVLQIPIPGDLLISAIDSNITDVRVLLRKYTPDPVCNQHYPIVNRVLGEVRDFTEKPFLTRLKYASMCKCPDLPLDGGEDGWRRFKLSMTIFAVFFVGDMLLAITVLNGYEIGPFTINTFLALLIGVALGWLSGVRTGGLVYSWRETAHIPYFIARISRAMDLGRKCFVRKMKHVRQMMRS